MGFILSISVLGLISFITFYINKKSSKKDKSEVKDIKTEKVKKVKVGETLSEFKRVERFDSEAYVEGTFETVLHDIKSDIEGDFNTWELKIDYSKIQFEKIKHRTQWDKCKITLNIEYTDYDEFEIKRIDLSTRSKTFSMKDINSEYYRFIYECYVKYITEKNTLEKERVDKSLSDINEIIGIDNLRDIKLDQILNGKD
jgi:hypothetical protein